LSLANANMTGEVAFIMDTSQIDGIKNSIDLIDILYPISFIMALAVGIFICNIQIVQSIKEIAIMRVLGTSKRKTCLIIVLEKFLLCCIGASFSIIVFHVRGILGRMWESIYIYLIVILLFSTITTFYLINRKVLTLLQVKE